MRRPGPFWDYKSVTTPLCAPWMKSVVRTKSPNINYKETLNFHKIFFRVLEQPKMSWHWPLQNQRMFSLWIFYQCFTESDLVKETLQAMTSPPHNSQQQQQAGRQLQWIAGLSLGGGGVEGG